MSAAGAAVDTLPPIVGDILQRYWGFETLRPLQGAAIGAVLERRDSVVVLPTGGGKSLCFQAPALLKPGLAVVVSPLISLMKDQVDGLNANGVAAACYNSALDDDQKRAVWQLLPQRREVLAATKGPTP